MINFLINYTLNIVKNLIFIDLLLKHSKKYIHNVDVRKILIGQNKPSTLLDFAVILQLLTVKSTVKYHIYDLRLTTVIHTALWVFLY